MCISPMAIGTFQKCFTKYHNWPDATQCIVLFMSSWAGLEPLFSRNSNHFKCLASECSGQSPFLPFGFLMGLRTDDAFLLFQTAIPMTYHKTLTTVVTWGEKSNRQISILFVVYREHYLGIKANSLSYYIYNITNLFIHKWFNAARKVFLCVFVIICDRREF